MASQVVELGSTPSGATNLAETAWVYGLSSEISVNQGRYRPFYGLCPQTFIQEKSAVNLWWLSYSG
jgi:hypothetical protein